MSSSGIVSPFGGEYASTSTPVAVPEPVRRDVVEEHRNVIEEFEVPAGYVLVARDKVAETWDKGGLIAATGDRVQMLQQFEPWATVLLVGPPRVTDYGTTIHPPNVKAGQRVLIHATAAENVELEAGGVTMTVTLVSFSAIKLIQRMQEATDVV